MEIIYGTFDTNIKANLSRWHVCRRADRQTYCGES